MNNETSSTKREQFSSKFGFIISCIGAAVGLGNIWMFSYRLGTYGGAAFLIPYFLFVFLLGAIGLIVEFSFGRSHRAGSLVGIRKVFRSHNLKGAKIIGFIPVLGLTGIFIFYSVVIGWLLKYFYMSFNGSLLHQDYITLFGNFTGSSDAIPWTLLSVAITLLIVLSGVAKGIEKLNKIAIPVLMIIFLMMIVRALTLEGSMKGVEYLLKPKWEALLNIETWVMALGQAFFTVSLTGCALVVYGSYASDKADLVSASFNTAFYDSIAALMAAFMIIPAVFALGLDPASGPSLLFITLPKVFEMMPYGQLLSVLFFLSVIFASITSSVSMLEGPVESIISTTKIKRKKATIIIAAVAALLTIPITLDNGLFGQFTDFITIILSPIGAMILAFVAVFLYSDKLMAEINKSRQKPVGRWFITYAKLIYVPVTVLIIILGIMFGGIG
jgi:NSS family neurotransmitter:Na+ symporter